MQARCSIAANGLALPVPPSWLNASAQPTKRLSNPEGAPPSTLPLGRSRQGQRLLDGVVCESSGDGDSSRQNEPQSNGVMVGSLLQSFGPGLGTVQIIASGRSAPNNDNVGAIGAKDNFFSMQVEYDFRALIDMQWEVENSNGVSEYWLAIEVFNRSNQNWGAFTFKLGFGHWTAFADNFQPSLLTDNLDFDTPNQDPTPFTTPTGGGATAFPQPPNHQADTLGWCDDVTHVPPGGSIFFYFQLDIPDYDSQEMPAFAQTLIGYKFTLRAYPGPFCEGPPEGGLPDGRKGGAGHGK
jgi:hypothetical protein